MRLLLAFLVAISLISCQNREPIPAKIDIRIQSFGYYTIEGEVDKIHDYGHFMHKLSLGKEITIHVSDDYRDRVDLIGKSRTIFIEDRQGHWFSTTADNYWNRSH